MEKAERAEGKARFMDLVWARLDSEGAVKPLRQSAEDYKKTRARLAADFCYLTPEAMAVLADDLLHMMARVRTRHCPSAIVIRGQARALEPPQVLEQMIVTTWLASVEGPRAIEGGYEVTLYRWLLAHAPPGPSEFTLSQIKANAAEQLRQRDIALERVSRGVADDGTVARLAAWDRDAARVAAIVAGSGS